MVNNLVPIEGLKTSICDVIVSSDDLQYYRGNRKNLFLLIADDGHFISFIGCNSTEELKYWAKYFNTFSHTEEEKTLIKCDVLDQYNLPYEIDKGKQVWVLMGGLSFNKYSNIKEAIVAIEVCLTREEISMSDISVLVGREIQYEEYE